MTTRERFDTKVVRQESGCWTWSGGHTKSGYPVFRIGSTKDGSRRQVGAHVYACELRHGAMPAGHQAHHLCHNRGCVNPEHLVPMSSDDHKVEHHDDRVEQGRRSAQRPAFRASFGRRDREKTQCRNGHPYDEANTYTHRGERGCRICRKAAGIRRRVSEGRAVGQDQLTWLERFEAQAAAHRRNA